MKYYVIATKWDETLKAQIKYVAGEFSTYSNAGLFRKAYNDHYKAEAEILTVENA